MGILTLKEMEAKIKKLGKELHELKMEWADRLVHEIVYPEDEEIDLLPR